MMLISKTFERVSYESAEHGEAEQIGFIFSDEPYSFSQLVHELREYVHTSSCPMQGTRFEWISTDDDEDYRTGDRTSYSLHFSHLNPPRLEKYWRKALQCAGFIKQ